MTRKKWQERIGRLGGRLRGLNEKIRRRRRKGHKTPGAAEKAKHVRKKLAYLKEHPPPPPPQHSGLVTMDSHQVPAWIADLLKRARGSGTWRGTVVSGYRTPAYSESLCYHICGAPSCPGRCAGRSTNHACPPDGRPIKPRGAVDVTDSAGLQRWMRSHGNPLRGNGEHLPYDTPHFSATGN